MSRRRASLPDVGAPAALLALAGCGGSGPVSGPARPPAVTDWAMRHDSLLILTWDENDGSPDNQIPTILAGQRVRPG